MKLRPGDKVKFLNEKGGGVVTHLLGSNMVKVEIESGFEIPVLIADLLKITDFESGTVERAFDNMKTKAEGKVENKPVTKSVAYVEEVEELVDDEDDCDDISPIYRNGGQVSQGIYMTFVPQDQKWVLTKGLDVYLINNTDYDVLYTLNLADDMIFDGVDYGSILPYSKKMISTITFEEVELWSRGVVQVLFQKETNNKIITPLSAEYDIKPVKFHKEGNYINFSLLGMKAFVYLLGELSTMLPIHHNMASKKSPEISLETTKAKETKEVDIIDKHIVKPNEAIVDLHANELFSDIDRLSPDKLLTLQLSYFEKCLEAGIKDKLYKITFIHGVGEGILKNAIISSLKRYVGKVYYESAPMKDYGAGAINVFILKRG